MAATMTARIVLLASPADAVPNSIRDADYTNVLPNTLSTSRDDNGVVRGTTYYYRVRSRDVDNRVSDWTQPLSVDVRN